MGKFDGIKKLLIDPRKMNYSLYKSINKKIEIIEGENPSILMKAIKNDVEIENIIYAHIKDGVSWTKYMFFVKNNIGKVSMTEMSSQEMLESFRKEQEGYMWPSFAPICGYEEHGAIVHYESSPKTDSTLKNKGLLLSDTGGNYLEGSTDITRTLVLGEISEEARKHFTLVLKSHIGLANAKFISGTSGYTLDMLARKPLWDNNLNYNHRTGHGVGYLLNVHEGPAGIRYKIVPSKNEHHPFEKGMIVTNEPGIYIEDKYGIRLENEMLVVEGTKNEYGQFLYFKPLTLVPFDLDGVDVSMLNEEEKDYLNIYHEMVYETISPLLNEEEVEWLKKVTKKI